MRCYSNEGRPLIAAIFRIKRQVFYEITSLKPRSGDLQAIPDELVDAGRFD